MSKQQKKNKSTPQDYASDLDAESMTGVWTPAGRWARIHGDGKSTTGGKFHMETMTTTTDPVRYQVRLINDFEKQTLNTWAYAAEPSFETVVADVQAWAGV